ncbi:class 1 fructose-bisphosphatase [Neisseria sp. Ec49-e6-T10]|uniref:class 1 fructose-bisphosphatase n=1 Tax=Neisseria sp. Ec49-e6-T10 TaxID=3140744 RepID=UPI003EBC7F60
MLDFQSFLQDYAQKHQVPEALNSVLFSLMDACAQIHHQVRQGALAGVLGDAGTGNVQGEQQKKLDVIANQILVDSLKANQSVAGLASEEEEEFILVNNQGNYLVLFDPLDGSSNIDVNISVGTIFSILAHQAGDNVCTESFLQNGQKQVASGYCLYGPQTQWVFTFGEGVFVFTLDQNTNTFLLTKDNVIVPTQTKEFAINMSNQRHWQKPVQTYIAELLAGEEGVRNKNYNMRWVASMVAEVHRILMRGGIFMYPRDNREPEKAGKLRLMYEANPMSLLIQAAGAKATDGQNDILSIKPEGLHQRVAVFLGSSQEVDYVTDLHKKS